MLVREFIPSYLAERPTCAKYAKALGYTVGLFERFLEQPPSAKHLNDDTVNRFIAWREVESSPTTARGHQVRLNSLWRAMRSAGHVKTRPKRKRKIRIPKLLPEAWELDQVRRLLAAADRLRGPFRGKVPVKRSAFWRALILTAYSTGLRLGDLERIRFEDVGTAGFIIFRQQKSASDVLVPISAEAVAAIQTINEPYRPFVFGGVIGRDAYYEAFRRLAHKAGLDGTTRWLRRTSGTVVERMAPGWGHVHLGNSADVFDAHYRAPRLMAVNRPLPPPLTSQSAC